MMSRRNIMIGTGAVALAGAALYALTRGPSYDELTSSVWVPRSSGSDPDLEYLVHYATLAANAHNTQPWLFSGSGSHVLIRPDLGRATPVVDPDNHHLYASLGCACENLVQAAAAIGKAAEPDFQSGTDTSIEIELSDSSRQDATLFEAILDRQCTRSDYENRAVPADELKRLEEAALGEGCRVVLVSDKSRIEQALEMIVAANTVQVENPEFVAELKSWIRFNAGQAAEKRDGLFTACTGNPSLPTWLGKRAFDFAFTAKAENDKLAGQIRSSSGLAIFVSDRDDKAHWVQAGRSYQRFALQATALGIRHAFINQPVEVAPLRPEFAGWLGIGDRRPDLVLRYGYAPPMPKSMRRPVKDVIL